MARSRDPADKDSLDEDPLPGDQDSTDEPAEVPCPFCKAPISEMAEVCPECGSYIVDDRERTPLKTRITRIAVVAIIILLTACMLRYR